MEIRTCAFCGISLKEDRSNIYDQCPERGNWKGPHQFLDTTHWPDKEKPMIKQLPKANEKQIGGEHYKASYECWDWIADCNIDFFRGTAVKYLLRWRKKNGVEDLEKALHFLEKYDEIGWSTDEEFELCETRDLINAHNLKETMEDVIIHTISRDDVMEAITLLRAFIASVKQERQEALSKPTPRESDAFFVRHGRFKNQEPGFDPDKEREGYHRITPEDKVIDGRRAPQA